MRQIARWTTVALAAGLIGAGCSSDDEADTTPTVVTAAPTSAAPTTTETASTTAAPDTTGVAPSTTLTAASTTTVPPATSLTARQLVEALAADDLAGRDNGSAGSVAAQELLIGQLQQFAVPALPDQAEGYLQRFAEGTNVVAVIPGGDLADQWVVIGAHYDHLGTDCPTTDPADTICNGATDNATGVAAAIATARSVAAAGVPRRSVLVAFWDAEEDGLLGSAAYVAAPIVPLAQTVAYVNFDIQGLNLLPSLANSTIMVGAETGGQALTEAALAATQASSLDTTALSLLFGQGRSDHANFAAAGVPSVFFTDANSACYHTSQDDVSIVDFDKLDQQILTSTALAETLVSTDVPPAFDGAAPATSYEDAVSMLGLVTKAEVDLPMLDPTAQQATEQYIADLQTIVDAGPAAFDENAVSTVLSGAVVVVDALTQGECSANISG